MRYSTSPSVDVSVFVCLWLDVFPCPIVCECVGMCERFWRMRLCAYVLHFIKEAIPPTLDNEPT
jgi:hypothetical protein